MYLAASVIQGVLVVVALPLTTIILGPSEYGIYALVTSVALALAAAADLGQNILFAGHYATSDVRERRSLFSSVLAASLTVSGAALWFFVLAWPWVAQFAGLAGAVTPGMLWIAAAAIPFLVVNNTVKQYLAVADRAGISKPVNPHVLRHSFSVTCLKRGVGLRTLQALLGHDNIQTTEIYMNLSPEEVVREFKEKW